MKIYKYGKFQLNEFERTLAETFTRTHRCPWYKRLFNDTRPEFSYSQSIDGIGTILQLSVRNVVKSLT